MSRQRSTVPDDNSDDAATLRQINAVLNWFEELKQKVPNRKK
jgi:hypothetical protein